MLASMCAATVWCCCDWSTVRICAWLLRLESVVCVLPEMVTNQNKHSNTEEINYHTHNKIYPNTILPNYLDRNGFMALVQRCDSNQIWLLPKYLGTRRGQFLGA